MTDADRDAAASQTIWSNEQRRDVLSGKLDHNPNVQVFERHAKTSIAPYVEALRKDREQFEADRNTYTDLLSEYFAKSIEVGNALQSAIENCEARIAQIDALLENNPECIKQGTQHEP